LSIKEIKDKITKGDYRITVHCLERMIERKISPIEIKQAVISGEIIEDYPEDKYGPSCLLLGRAESGRPLHVQISLDPVWVITVYDPSEKPDEWSGGYRKRRV
jgi:hypothetical protein